MEPVDPLLYAAVKRQVYHRMPRHSAYRSGHLVWQYTRAFHRKHGSRTSPYRGHRSPRTRGLRRWFAEQWTNPRGEVGYRYASDVYRPTRRISRQTPTTYAELSPLRLRRARRQKARSGRVGRF
jgi:hypothetical protein